VQELEILLEYLGVCCLWINLSGLTNHVKKDFNSKKIFKAMKDYEEHIPGWVIDALEGTDYILDKNFSSLFR